MRPMTMNAEELWSIIVPVFNEQDVLPVFHERVCAVLEKLSCRAEIIYVNDGSSDDSARLLLDLYKRDGRISIVDLSRNFGKEIAMTAALDHAHGDAVVIIDADLQDPPELIPELIRGWRQGYDVV